MPRCADAHHAAVPPRSPSTPTRVLQLAAAGDERYARAFPAPSPLSVERHPALARRDDRRIDHRRSARRADRTLLQQTLQELAAARAREGAKLRAVLEARCTAIETQVARVAPRIPAVHAAFVEKLGGATARGGRSTRSGPAEAGTALVRDQDRRRRRSVAPLHARRRSASRTGAGGSAGKRLDFLMQELHREANTLGSKSVDAELSQASLELKVLIEQMREQVQNIE